MTGNLIQPDHLFSQHSLNTYVRCPRRFLLKYVDRQPWPMPEQEDPLAYQRHLERGRVFHQWLARDHLGMDMTRLVAECEDPTLQRWWRAATAFDRESLPGGIREAELPVVVPLGTFRLYARYDLLALDPAGEAVIVDWKTLERVPPAQALRSRVQTRVYLYTLIAAGPMLTGGAAIAPDEASMFYWFANYPDDSATIAYSRAAHEADARYLLGLVQEIAARDREAFARTEDLRLCTTCNYRSLCGREGRPATASDLEWLDEDIDFRLDVEEVPELEY